jgi:hypothetical protein
MIAATYARKRHRMFEDGRRFLPTARCASVTALLMLVATTGCVSPVVRGEFDGPQYVNRKMRYAFTIPSGWHSDAAYLESLAQGVGQPAGEIALRDSSNSSLILGISALRSWRLAGSLGEPRLLTGPDKSLLLRDWFPEIPAAERDRLTAEVRQFGENIFAVVSGPPVCSLSERLHANKVNRAWDRFAVTEAGGYVYSFMSNLCHPVGYDSFDALLASVRFLK